LSDLSRPRLLLRSSEPLRQLGDVGGDAPGLEAVSRKETDKTLCALPSVSETEMMIGLEIIALVVLLLAILGFIGFDDLGLDWRSARRRDGAD
jgi:hypothetical protein